MLRKHWEPLRGIWLGWGVLLAWASFALPHPYGWLAFVAAAGSALVPRSRGTRAAFALGLLLEAGLFLAVWNEIPSSQPCTGSFAISVEREIRAGRYEGTLREAPERDLVGRRVRLVADQAEVGTLLSGRGTLRPPRPASNPGGFDEARWAAAAGLVGTLRFDSSATTTGTATSGWDTFRQRLDASVRSTLSSRLETYSADLWIATLLADGSRLPLDVNSAFRQTGLYHMLSVSGFHLVVLGGAAIALLSLLRAGSTAASLGALAIVWAYVAFLDWPDPAVRSGVAFTGFILARWTGRTPHSGNALGLGLGLLVLLDPNCPFQAGVQLTVAATAALIWLSPGLERLLLPRRLGGWPRDIAKALVASLAATLATAPILAWNTGFVPWIGIPAGLLASCFFSAGFLASLAVVALGALPAAWSSGFAGTADLCARAVLEIALRAGSWDFGWFRVVRPEISFLVLWTAFLVALAACAWEKPIPRRGLVASSVLAALLVWNPLKTRPIDALTIDFLSVGQGDAALLRVPGAGAWLVDGGPATRGPKPRDAGADVVLPAMRALRIGSLEGIVVTHPDLDHWGGVPAVAAATPPRLLVEPGATNPDPSPGWDSARRTILRGPSRATTLLAGQFLPLGDRGALVALAPGAGTDVPDRNSTSLVLSARWGEARALLAGDAESWSEGAMIENRATLRSPLLKVSHHGSKGASTTEFLQAVGPSWAVISCGERNRFGHPHRETLERLAGTGARILDTRERAWEARLHADGRIEILPAHARWWNGPWRRGDLSFPPQWTSNRHSETSSKARASSGVPCGGSSRPTTSSPTGSPVPAKTDRS